MNNLRMVLCCVDPEWHPDDKFVGWFHAWAGTSERAYALVEHPDGTMREIKADALQFVQRPDGTN